VPENDLQLFQITLFTRYLGGQLNIVQDEKASLKYGFYKITHYNTVIATQPHQFISTTQANLTIFPVIPLSGFLESFSIVAFYFILFDYFLLLGSLSFRRGVILSTRWMTKLNNIYYSILSACSVYRSSEKKKIMCFILKINIFWSKKS